MINRECISTGRESWPFKNIFSPVENFGQLRISQANSTGQQTFQKSKVEGLMSHKLSGDTSVSVCFSPDLDIMSGDRPDTPSTESVVSCGDE